MSFCFVKGMDTSSDMGFTNYNGFSVKYMEHDTPNSLRLFIDGNDIAIFLGNPIDIPSLKDFVFADWMSSYDLLISTNSSFSVLRTKTDENKVFIASCITGIERLFYYHTESTFIVSDNFWDIVKLVQPSYDDINSTALFQSFINIPLECKTIIKHLDYLPPATIGEYNGDRDKLNTLCYWKLKFNTENGLSLSDATALLDKELSETFSKVKNACGDVTYAVGLSGGLDSRIIPHYTHKCGMKTLAYIISEKKPHGLMLSRDNKSARALSKKLNVPLFEIPTNSGHYEEGFNNGIKYNPLGESPIFIDAGNRLPAFDILFTGSFGAAVGAGLANGINAKSNEEVRDLILNKIKLYQEESMFTSRVRRIMHEFFGIQTCPKIKNESWKDNIIRPEIHEQMSRTILENVNNAKNNGDTNIDIYERYAISELGASSRYGAFESVGGTKKSFYIWNASTLKLVTKCKTECLVGRAIVKELVTKYIPEAAGIQSQSYDVPIGKSHSIPSRIVALTSYIFRGAGTMGYYRWTHRREYKKLYHNIMDRNTTWFSSFFSLTEKEKVDILKNQYRLSHHLMCQKRILDILETKEYNNE